MLGNAVQEASDYGVALVAAAGNDDGGPREYPAAYPGVLSVGATDTQGGGFCSFSNRGEGLRLLAPGCDLDGAEPTSGAPDYNYWQGTSGGIGDRGGGTRRAVRLSAELVGRSWRERSHGR